MLYWMIETEMNLQMGGIKTSVVLGAIQPIRAIQLAKCYFNWLI